MSAEEDRELFASDDDGDQNEDSRAVEFVTQQTQDLRKSVAKLNPQNAQNIVDAVRAHFCINDNYGINPNSAPNTLAEILKIQIDKCISDKVIEKTAKKIEEVGAFLHSMVEIADNMLLAERQLAAYKGAQGDGPSSSNT